MVESVGSAVIALSQNATLLRPRQDDDEASVNEEVARLVQSTIQGLDDKAQEKVSPLIPPVNPAGLSVLLAAQGEKSNVLDGELTPEEEEEVKELQQRDQEVRAHELAHKNAAGPYAGNISYTTETGPDGREYATDGHVDIDVAPIPGNPEATIRKMEIVQRAALAVAEPSPEDLQVARTAEQAKQEARQELQEKRDEEKSGEDPDSNIITVLFGASSE